MYSSFQAFSSLPTISFVHLQQIDCIFWQNHYDPHQTIVLFLYLIVIFFYSIHQFLFSTLIPLNLAYSQAILLPTHLIQLLWFNLTWLEEYLIHPHRLIIIIQRLRPITFGQACRMLTFSIVLSSIFLLKDQRS